MVNPPFPRESRKSGFLTTELLVALAIILIAVMPLVALHLGERRLARACYERSVAMEVVDGEMEVLLAGEWQAFPRGTTEYPLSEAIRSNLPPGSLSLTLGKDDLRLEWTPSGSGLGGSVVRVGRLP